MSKPEYGREMRPETGEHLHHGQLDLDVWAYKRMGSGFTVCVKQMPPQPMLEALGTADMPPTYWTVNVARGLTTFLPFAEADDLATRIPFDSVDDEVQRIVWDHAGEGWIWNDIEWRYDATSDTWVAA